jgi:hypothetical protein
MKKKKEGEWSDEEEEEEENEDHALQEAPRGEGGTQDAVTWWGQLRQRRFRPRALGVFRDHNTFERFGTCGTREERESRERERDTGGERARRLVDSGKEREAGRARGMEGERDSGGEHVLACTYSGC